MTLPQASRRVPMQRLGRSTAPESTHDRVAVEAPLQVIVDGEPFAVIMRTPGDDQALAAGFLFSEGVISSAADLASIACGRSAGGQDEIAVTRIGETRARAAARRVTTNASCGMCGRVRVESIEIDRPPLAVEWHVDPAVIAALPERLRAAQTVFAETGGLHAAGLFDLDGTLIAHAEDVGRHNAVDRIVGRVLLEGMLPLSQSLLMVSGRVAFEIVQKALLAGIPLVAAVSAPSSLAVELAVEGGITLAGFVRDGAFNVYAHAERLAPSSEVGSRKSEIRP